MRYAVVIEKAGDNYSAYVPDLPGCIATGATVAETENEIREAIRFHFEGLREDGISIPQAQSTMSLIDMELDDFPSDRELVDVSYVSSGVRRLQVA